MEQHYEENARKELLAWQIEMQRKPGISDRLSRKLQGRVNSLIPERMHKLLTTAIKHMVGAMISGSNLAAPTPLINESLQYRESLAKDRISFYKNTSAAEGAITGAGGFISSVADFPLWLGLKMKMLTDIAGLYGHDLHDVKERLYLLYIFQACFSGRKNKREVYNVLADWERFSSSVANDPKNFNWRKFQQEYRDYIDLAKLIQMIPGVGAVAGAYVNHRLTEKLGTTAMNAYRLRWFNSSPEKHPAHGTD